MHLKRSASIIALIAGVGLGAPALAASADQTAPQNTLEELVVTAQKREVNLQQAPLSISAVGGETLARDKIMNSEDLGHATVGLSFTQNSPQALELNIRGVVNTRLSAPTADQSVSTFVDDVYVSRSGNLNTSFYDIDRVELIRGPQGVVLGKNVAGGAISVISAEPRFDYSGQVAVTFGNYNLQQTTGHVTGPITSNLAGRLSFQTINHSGYAKDILHDVDLEDLDSKQIRGQLLYKPEGSDLRVRFIADYNWDTSNGPNRVGMGETTCTTPTRMLRAVVQGPPGHRRPARRSLHPREPAGVAAVQGRRRPDPPAGAARVGQLHPEGRQGHLPRCRLHVGDRLSRRPGVHAV
ncbi:TonB-dependent receptor [Caulobacter sp. UC70_42]|uniref:TonB-dependent receptor n=1 Tax=Caulobacter sp. UC70_42 TaxID=3374551 RepID=UPI003758310F